MFIILLLTIVACRNVLTSQWSSYTSMPCTTPPDVMYGWNLTNDFQSSQKNSSWPYGYKYMAKLGKTFGKKCFSTVKVDLDGACCGMVVDPSDALGYAAISTVEASPLAYGDYVSYQSVGAKYCHLRSSGGKTLFGLDEAFYLPTGKCVVPDNVKCNSDFTLQIYSGENCSGDSVTVQLTPDLSPVAGRAGNVGSDAIIQTKLGNVAGSIHTIGQARVTYQWTALVPVNQYTPKFDIWSDYMLVAGYILSLLCIVVSILYFLQKYLKNRKRLPLYYIGNLTLWLGFCGVRFASAFNGNYTSAWDATIFLLQMMGSLTSVYLSIDFTLQIKHVSRWTKILWYSFVTIIHLGMNWNNYTRAFPLGFLFTKPVVDTMFALNYAWILIMFFGDCIPPVALLLGIFREFKHKQTFYSRIRRGFRDIWKRDKLFCVILFGQLNTAVAFVLESYMRNYSDVLADDRIWLSFLAIDCLTQALHCTLNVLLIDAMTMIVKENVTTLTSSAEGSTLHSKA